jgi:hypothetical protein
MPPEKMPPLSSMLWQAMRAALGDVRVLLTRGPAPFLVPVAQSLGELGMACLSALAAQLPEVAMDFWYHAVRWPAPRQAPRSGWQLVADLSSYAALLAWGFVLLAPCSSSVLGGAVIPLWCVSLPLGLGLTCNAAVLRAAHARRTLDP